jgi:tRNA-splicing ligase RtcB
MLYGTACTNKTGMLVPARIYATEKLIEAMDAGIFEQTSNVACLSCVVGYSFCMPDGHCGYGFPIDGDESWTLTMASHLRRYRL